MKTFYAEIEIGAPSETVWSHVTDLAGYGEWHAIIPSIGGDLQEGAVLEVRITDVARSMRCRVLHLEPGRELRMLALWPLGLLRPVHTLRVEPLDDGRTRFVCEESFSGLLLPLVASNLERSVGPRYRETCEALKSLVEEEQSRGTQSVR
jgi:hypothetical protein